MEKTKKAIKSEYFKNKVNIVSYAKISERDRLELMLQLRPELIGIFLATLEQTSPYFKSDKEDDKYLHFISTTIQLFVDHITSKSVAEIMKSYPDENMGIGVCDIIENQKGDIRMIYNVAKESGKVAYICCNLKMVDNKLMATGNAAIMTSKTIINWSN